MSDQNVKSEASVVSYKIRKVANSGFTPHHSWSQILLHDIMWDGHFYKLIAYYFIAQFLIKPDRRSLIDCAMIAAPSEKLR